MMAHPMAKNKRTTYLSPGQTSDAPSSNTPLTPEPAASLNNQHNDSAAGPPSRHHWKPDSEASHCEYPGCTTSFGLFDRRHHCRRCGDIYCTHHCSSYFKLDQDCRFHPDGTLSRCCDTCEVDYHSWIKITEEQRQLSLKKKSLEPSLTASLTSTLISSSTQPLQKQSSLKNFSSFSKRHPGIMTQQPHALEGVTEVGKEDIVSPVTQQQFPSNNISINTKKTKNTAFNPVPSVPADWQWSTF